MARLLQSVAALAVGGLLMCGCATPREPAAPAVPFPAREGAAEAKPKPPGRGAAALAYVLQRGGVTVEVAALDAELQEIESGGLAHEDALVEAAARRGLWAYAQSGSLDKLADRANTGAPVLVAIEDPRKGIGTRRFVAVTSFDTRKRELAIVRADGMATTMSENDFWTRWEPAAFWMMTATPIDSADWAMTALERVSRMRQFDKAGRPDRGDQEAAQALIVDPRNVELCISLALRERLRGRPDGAEQMFRRALKIDPTSARAANNLAYLFAESKRNLPEAEQLVRTALAAEPTNPRVLDTLGYVLMAGGRADEAIPYLALAYRRSAVLPAEVQREIGFRLLRAFLADGRRVDARAHLDAMRAAEPGLLVPSDLAREFN